MFIRGDAGGCDACSSDADYLRHHSLLFLPKP